MSRITDKILPIVREWQQRPLEGIYAVVFLDAIHYHVRSEGQIVKKAVYIAIGIDLNGRKDVLGMWVGENEGCMYSQANVHPMTALTVPGALSAPIPHRTDRPFGISLLPGWYESSCYPFLRWGIA